MNLSEASRLLARSRYLKGPSKNFGRPDSECECRWDTPLRGASNLRRKDSQEAILARSIARVSRAHANTSGGSPDSSQFVDRHGRDSRTINAYRQVRFEIDGDGGPNVKSEEIVHPRTTSYSLSLYHVHQPPPRRPFPLITLSLC